LPQGFAPVLKEDSAEVTGKRSLRRSLNASHEDNQRPLKDFIVRHCPESPVGFLNKLLRKGFVLVDGMPADEKARLRCGQRIEVWLPEGTFLVAPNPEVVVRMIYEDDFVAVLDKPVGLVSEPGIGHKLDTLLNGLIARYGAAQDRIGPEHDYGMVHRLDRDTSGLMVIARDVETHQRLSAQFRRHEAKKRYTALVVGRLAQQSGEVRLPLGRVRRGGRAVGFAGADRPFNLAQGRTLRALTRYRVLERFRGATLVEAFPQTGRWRQIRLHFNALGHPVAGDPDEGDAIANAELARSVGLRRMFLHAGYLKFRHPKTARSMAFSLALPDELESALARLRARNPR
jgi:23S rRNA pseudouridine1911/1915/1917 synthase